MLIYLIFSFLEESRRYWQQASEYAKRHKEAKDIKEGTDEFLSGITANDKLIPVVTLTLYFGSREWDAPMSLREMFDADKYDPRILSCIPDYRINLLTPKDIGLNDSNKFSTDIWKAFEVAGVKDNKDALAQIVTPERGYDDISDETGLLISALGNINLPKEHKGGYNMCKAIRDLCEDSRTEGLSKGRTEGRIKGRTEGLSELAQAIQRLKTGETPEQLLQSGVKKDVVDLAVACR